MGERKKENDAIDPDGSIEKRAVETGFLCGVSINHFEKYTRDELIKEGYNEAQVEIANRVLAHFDTSVGAKLGRCPPELWQLRPCVDCETTVDQRFNPGRDYGVVLCGDCKIKRDSEHICFKCLGTADDPAEDWPLVRRRHTGRNEQGEIQHEYLCTWCAIQFGHNDFFDKRGGTGFLSNDKAELLRKLRIQRTKDRWRFEKIVFDGDWEGYVATYTGVLVAELPEDPGDDFELDFPGLILRDQKDPRRFYGVCRIRVYHRDYRAYLEALFLKPLSGSDPGFDIRNLHLKSSPEEIRKISEARELVWKIAAKRGRRLGGRSQSRELLLSSIKKVIYEHGPDASRTCISVNSGLGRSSFYDNIRHYTITDEDIEKLRQEVRVERRAGVCPVCNQPIPKA